MKGHVQYKVYLVIIKYTVKCNMNMLVDRARMASSVCVKAQIYVTFTMRMWYAIDILVNTQLRILYYIWRINCDVH